MSFVLMARSLCGSASLPLRFSASASGSLSCLSRAASKLARRAQTVDAAFPHLRRDFQRLGVNLR